MSLKERACYELVQSRETRSLQSVNIFVCPICTLVQKAVFYFRISSVAKPKTSWLIGQLKWAILKYSGTPLNRPPLGHKILEVITRLGLQNNRELKQQRF